MLLQHTTYYYLYIWSIMLLFICLLVLSGGHYSIARYYMEVFPAFIIFALWSYRGNEEQRMTRHMVIVTTSAILLALGMVLWTLGIYSVA